jgi:hypothetical protein
MSMSGSLTDVRFISPIAHCHKGIDCQANQVSATSEECNAAWGICNVGLNFGNRLFFNAIFHLHRLRMITARIPLPLYFPLVEDEKCLSFG